MPTISHAQLSKPAHRQATSGATQQKGANIGGLLKSIGKVAVGALALQAASSVPKADAGPAMGAACMEACIAGCPTWAHSLQPAPPLAYQPVQCFFWPLGPETELKSKLPLAISTGKPRLLKVETKIDILRVNMTPIKIRNIGLALPKNWNCASASFQRIEGPNSNDDVKLLVSFDALSEDEKLEDYVENVINYIQHGSENTGVSLRVAPQVREFHLAGAEQAVLLECAFDRSFGQRILQLQLLALSKGIVAIINLSYTDEGGSSNVRQEFEEILKSVDLSETPKYEDLELRVRSNLNGFIQQV